MRYVVLISAVLACASCSKSAPQQKASPSASAAGESANGESANAAEQKAPQEAAWGRAQQLSLSALEAYGCSANLLPPWLRISCVAAPERAAIVAFERGTPSATIAKDEGPGGKGPSQVSITFPLQPRQVVMVPARVSGGTEASKARTLQLRFEWAGGQAKPIVSIER